MWTYVENELDSAYSKPLPDVQRLKDSDLPKSEFELRAALAKWLMCDFVPANSLSWFDKTFNKADYQNKKNSLEKADAELKNLITNPANMAALRRVISVMPDYVSQKQYLIDNFITQ